jgi:preprotein translocase subunit SecD
MTFTSRSSLIIQALIWIAVALSGIYFITHIRSLVSFGIDLVGGTYITLEVHTEEALYNTLVDKSQRAQSILQSSDIPLPRSSRVSAEEAYIDFTFNTPEDADKARQLLSEKDPSLEFTREENDLYIRFSHVDQRLIAQEAVQGNIDVLRMRLDQMGAGEVNIAAQGEKRILIELPDVKDVELAKQRIGRTALLEIKPVEDVADSEEDMLAKYDGNLPENTMIVMSAEQSSDDETRYKKTKEQKAYLVPEHAEITGRMLSNAQAQVSQGLEHFGRGRTPYYVQITFKKDAADRWYDLTSRVSEGRQTGESTGMLAMILDDVVIQAASVDKPIEGTDVVLQGSMSQQDSQDIAMLLKSGAFTARVSFAEERTIGPSLGSDSIYQGLIACGIALVLLFLFSVISYKVAGLLAFVVLIYNLLLILFGLWYIQATLTLPGIAGMVLTIGMAIDSSILIYEKIKDELALGVPSIKAVKSGFDGVVGVILDANITTFIVAFVLYKLGTGPIQGFAITMMIGIVSTLITGIILLKLLFNILFYLFGLQKVKI